MKFYINEDNYNGDPPYFDEDELTWSEYEERLEHFFSLNNLDSTKKLELFKSIIRLAYFPPNTSVFRQFSSYEKTFEFVKIQFCEPSNQTTILEQRYNFYISEQQPNETPFQWFERVLKLSTGCRFQSNFKLVILDKFISGLMPSEALNKLLKENSKLTLEKALEIACGDGGD